MRYKMKELLEKLTENDEIKDLYIYIHEFLEDDTTTITHTKTVIGTLMITLDLLKRKMPKEEYVDFITVIGRLDE